MSVRKTKPVRRIGRKTKPIGVKVQTQVDPNNTTNQVENTLVEADVAVATDATAADAVVAADAATSTDVKTTKAERAAGTSLVTAADKRAT